MSATQEQEVPYLSPEDYVRLREPIQTAWKIAGLSEGLWPPGTPLELQRLTACTTPGERLEGIKTGQWPFEWGEMLNRTLEQVAEMRYREQVRGLAPVTSDLLKAEVLARPRINIEEFEIGADEALNLLYPSISSSMT